MGTFLFSLPRPAFALKQTPLACQAAGVAAQRSVRPDDAMARHERRVGIPAQRMADGAGRARMTDLLCHPLVGSRFALWNPQDRTVDLSLKGGQSSPALTGDAARGRPRRRPTANPSTALRAPRRQSKESRAPSREAVGSLGGAASGGWAGAPPHTGRRRWRHGLARPLPKLGIPRQESRGPGSRDGAPLVRRHRPVRPTSRPT